MGRKRTLRRWFDYDNHATGEIAFYRLADSPAVFMTSYRPSGHHARNDTTDGLLLWRGARQAFQRSISTETYNAIFVHHALKITRSAAAPDPMSPHMNRIVPGVEQAASHVW